MYSIINNKLKQKISILALLKQFKSKINLSRNNFGHLWWLNFERQKKVNIKGICSFVKDFGNFFEQKWSNIVEYSRRKTFLIPWHHFALTQTILVRLFHLSPLNHKTLIRTKWWIQSSPTYTVLKFREILLSSMH